MKTNLDSLFDTDPHHEKEGVWLKFSETIGFRIKPFKASNPQVKKAMSTHFKPYARMIENGTLEDRKEREVMAKVFVAASLVDWRGIIIDGQETPFDKELAIKMLTDKEALFEQLFSYAQDFKNFKIDQDELDALGNS